MELTPPGGRGRCRSNDPLRRGDDPPGPDLSSTRVASAPVGAPTVLSRGQKAAIPLGLVALAFGFVEAPVITIVAVTAP